MYPHNTTPKLLTIDCDKPIGIVLVTKWNLHHQYFTYKLTRKFNDQVKCCYIYDKPHKRKKMPNSEIHNRYFQFDSKFSFYKKYFFYKYYNRYMRKASDSTKRLIRFIQWEIDKCKTQIDAESLIKRIAESRLKEETFLNELDEYKPFILISLGGPMLPNQMISKAEMAINQHSGYSPEYKGSYTTWLPLFQKNIQFIGNTVHITTAFVDEGDILRRSTPYLSHDDDHKSIGLKIALLGTEMIVDVVEKLLKDRAVRYFEQEKRGLNVVQGSYYWPQMEYEINRSFKNSWFKNELSRLKNF